MDEKTLIESLQQGDEKSFELLVRLHHRAAYHMAYRYMKDHSGADDVVQESFLKAYRYIGSFRQDSSFKSWLLKIVRNTALNVLRSKHYKKTVNMEDDMLGSAQGDFTGVERGQTLAILKEAIKELPPRQKLALELRIFEDMSFKEVSEVMECPFDTAKANFRHALMNLRKILHSVQGGKNIQELRLALQGLTEEH